MGCAVPASRARASADCRVDAIYRGIGVMARLGGIVDQMFQHPTPWARQEQVLYDWADLAPTSRTLGLRSCIRWPVASRSMRRRCRRCPGAPAPVG